MSKKISKTLSKGSSGSSSSLWHCIALILLCGCSAQENETPEQDKSVPIGVQASLVGNKEQLDTRAVSPGLIATAGKEMGVFLTEQNGYKPAYDKKYTYQSTGLWTSDEPIYVDKRPAKLVVYYDPDKVIPFTSPVKGTVSNAEALKAQKFDADKLWYFDNPAQTDVTSSNPGINFKLKPAYARMTLSIKRDEKYYMSGVCAISKVELSSNGTFAKTGTLDILTEETTGSTEGAYSIDPAITGIAAGATITCDLLLPPQDVNVGDAGLKIELTIDGIVRRITIPKGNFANNKVEPGNRYNIALLLLTTAEVKLVSVTNIIDWSTETDGGSGIIDI